MFRIFDLKQQHSGLARIEYVAERLKLLSFLGEERETRREIRKEGKMFAKNKNLHCLKMPVKRKIRQFVGEKLPRNNFPVYCFSFSSA